MLRGRTLLREDNREPPGEKSTHAVPSLFLIVHCFHRSSINVYKSGRPLVPVNGKRRQRSVGSGQFPGSCSHVALQTVFLLFAPIYQDRCTRFGWLREVGVLPIRTIKNTRAARHRLSRHPWWWHLLSRRGYLQQKNTFVDKQT